MARIFRRRMRHNRASSSSHTERNKYHSQPQQPRDVDRIGNTIDRIDEALMEPLPASSSPPWRQGNSTAIHRQGEANWQKGSNGKYKNVPQIIYRGKSAQWKKENIWSKRTDGAPVEP